MLYPVFCESGDGNSAVSSLESRPCPFRSSGMFPPQLQGAVVVVLVTQLSPTLCDPMDYSPPGSSVHGIFQARILGWVAIAFSRGSSQLRVWTQVSCFSGRFCVIWATGYSLHKYMLVSTQLRLQEDPLESVFLPGSAHVQVSSSTHFFSLIYILNPVTFKFYFFNTKNILYWIIAD